MHPMNLLPLNHVRPQNRAYLHSLHLHPSAARHHFTTRNEIPKLGNVLLLLNIIRILQYSLLL
jgi:hypothetical protein